MPAAPIPDNEAQRLLALRRLLILDSNPEPPFDLIVGMVKREFGMPIVAVSLVDEEREWYKACSGTVAEEGDRAIAFCSHTILSAKPLIVPDALADERFRDNPQVTQQGIRFYAGAPLILPTGERIGALCVKATHPYQPTPQQIAFLQDMARVAVDLMVLRYDSHRRKEALARLDHMDRVIHQRNRELEYTASHDPLTGLANRHGLGQHLKEALELSRKASAPLAILYFDLDRFKIVNDSLGHSAGDKVLKAITTRTLTVLERMRDRGEVEGFVAARPGGDEFVVLLRSPRDTETVMSIAEKLLASIGQPIDVGGHVFYTTASMGMVACDACKQACHDPTSLIRNADAAMYAAKAAGKNCCVVYDDSMHERMTRRLSLEAELHKALERNEFKLLYQPIVGIHEPRIEGCEVLIRWERPGEGVVSPTEFIPIAEECGLIVDIGQWVLEQSLAQLADWRRRGLGGSDLYVSVNFSKVQLLRSTIVEEICRATRDAGLNPGDFKIEITETAVMECPDVITATLCQLKELGYKFSMDDFGTGQSSLNCIHQFPIEVVKIDRAFIENLQRGRHFTAVVQSIITLASNLGMRVVAEGIETLEQLAQVQALDCDSAQGYLFAKPISAAELEKMLREPDSMHYERLRCA